MKGCTLLIYYGNPNKPVNLRSKKRDKHLDKNLQLVKKKKSKIRGITMNRRDVIILKLLK